jgi:hypothetical protein
MDIIQMDREGSEKGAGHAAKERDNIWRISVTFLL